MAYSPRCVAADEESAEVGNMEELISFAKEMLSQKPTRGLLKVYLVGSVFALLGTVIGLVETVCNPFSSGDAVNADMALFLSQEQRTVEAELQRSVGGPEEEEEEKELTEKNVSKTQSVSLSKTHRLSQRSMANRLHAS